MFGFCRTFWLMPPVGQLLEASNAACFTFAKAKRTLRERIGQDRLQLVSL
jgi:hypothetical protein